MFDRNLWLKEYRKKHPEKCSEWGRKYARNNRVRKYGLSNKQFVDLLNTQGGVCAICGKPETRHDNQSKNKTCNLSIDHNHKTGKLRGLLCNNCNTGIGHLKVDEEGIELLLAAISYVKNNE